MYEKVLSLDRCNFDSKELSHDILSYFGQVQNYISIKGNLKIEVY